jgi:hypothetical protein
MTSPEQEAAEVGLWNGWSLACTVDDQDVELGEPEVPQRFASVGSHYRAGWREGVERYRSGFNPDGTPMDS